MLLQEFVRGISGLTKPEAEHILTTSGLECAALRGANAVSVHEAEAQLGETALDLHRHDHAAFGPSSPYVSTSAGTYIEGNSRNQVNQAVFALDTALTFAVLMHQSDGWVFYGYTFLLGRPAVHHAEFAEEVRDLHQHPAWSKYRDEGELAVGVRVPPRRLRLAEHYRYSDVLQASAAGQRPQPDHTNTLDNAAIYQPPETISSARGVI